MVRARVNPQKPGTFPETRRKKKRRIFSLFAFIKLLYSLSQFSCFWENFLVPTRVKHGRKPARGALFPKNRVSPALVIRIEVQTSASDKVHEDETFRSASARLCLSNYTEAEGKTHTFQTSFLFCKCVFPPAEGAEKHILSEMLKSKTLNELERPKERSLKVSNSHIMTRESLAIRYFFFLQRCKLIYL